MKKISNPPTQKIYTFISIVRLVMFLKVEKIHVAFVYPHMIQTSQVNSSHNHRNMQQLNNRFNRRSNNPIMAKINNHHNHRLLDRVGNFLKKCQQSVKIIMRNRCYCRVMRSISKMK